MCRNNEPGFKLSLKAIEKVVAADQDLMLEVQGYCSKFQQKGKSGMEGSI